MGQQKQQEKKKTQKSRGKKIGHLNYARNKERRRKKHEKHMTKLAARRKMKNAAQRAI